MQSFPVFFPVDFHFLTVRYFRWQEILRLTASLETCSNVGEGGGSFVLHVSSADFTMFDHVEVVHKAHLRGIIQYPTYPQYVFFWGGV